VRTVDYEDVQDAAKQAEKHLDRVALPKTHRKGVVFQFTVGFGGRIPASYRSKGHPESSAFVITRGVDDWFLTKVSRLESPTKDKLSFCNIRDYQEIIINNLEDA